MIEHNKNNFRFYKNIGVENLRELSMIGGFDSCKDMELSWPHIQNSKRILELGAGSGRCIQYLVDKGFDGEIVAIEQSDDFFKFLEENHKSSATLIHGDFVEYNFEGKFDSVLWMWSGILDFSEDEQLLSLEKIQNLLNDKGVLAIDTPRIGFKTFAQHGQDEQHLHLETTFGDLHCYIPSKDDLDKMSKKAGFTSIEAIDYNTSTDKERTIYFIFKS